MTTKIIFSESFLTVYSNHFELQNARHHDDTEGLHSLLHQACQKLEGRVLIWFYFCFVFLVGVYAYSDQGKFPV